MGHEASKKESWPEMQKVLQNSERRAAAGQFSACIMHEINNPLEAISNIAYLIKLEANDAAKVREYSALLEVELANVIRLARLTLSFHKPSNARSQTNLTEVAESALRVHERKINTKGIHLVKDLAQEATLETHPGEMLQLLSNIIGNAVDALHDSGTLSIRVRKSALAVHVTITDNGHGIPDHLLEQIFDPFFTTKGEQGTGLGLAISKSIVEGHEGTISTHSSTRTGQSGTAFHISLPIERRSASISQKGKH